MTPRRASILAFVAAAFVASSSTPLGVDAAVTYVKPNWAPVSEWSPASARTAAATLHSTAMQAYATALDADPRMKPCVYC